jgi:hypothetical protein
MTSDEDLTPDTGEQAAHETGEQERDERGMLEEGFSRRALIRAGWSVPVILAVAPTAAFAASGGGAHTDVAAHVDGATVTAHIDV